MENLVTVDYSKFGYRELDIAGKLLAIYSQGGVDFLEDGITVNFNMNSGYVFLSDSNYNVGVLADGETQIVQFFSCMECGYEGTQDDALMDEKDFVTYEGYCSEECYSKNM